MSVYPVKKMWPLGLFYVFLLFFSVTPNGAEIVYKATAVLVYGAKGEDVILRPPPITETIQRTEWKHDESIAAGWYGDKSECLGQFEGRCEVNTDTGALTIKGLNLNDSGIYTPEINGKVFNNTQLSVISPVAKPSVETFCNAEKTRCLLACEGNTAEAEPVTYMWFIDGKHGPSDKVLSINKDTKEKSFRCLMKNPVSSKTSESITNPVIKQEQDRQASILGVVLLSVVVVIGVAVFIYKTIKKRRKRAQYEKLEEERHEKIQQIRERKNQQRRANTKRRRKEQEDAKKRIKELEGMLQKKQARIWQQKRAHAEKLIKELEDTDAMEEDDERRQTALYNAKKLQRELEDTVEDGMQLVEKYAKLQRQLEVFIFKETKHDMDPLNQPPDGEGQTNTSQNLSDGAEAESVTPETSNQSPEEAAASNTDQEAELTSVEVHNPPSPLTSGYQQGL